MYGSLAGDTRFFNTFSFCSSQVSLRKRINDSSSCYFEIETLPYGVPLHGTHGSAQPEIFHYTNTW